MGLFDLFQAKNKSEDVKKHTLVVVDWDSCRSTQDFQFLLKIAETNILCFTRRPQDANLDQFRQLVKCTVHELPEYESSLPLFLTNTLIYELQTNRVYKHVIIVSGTSQYQGTIAFLKEKRQSAELINLQPAMRNSSDRRNNLADRRRPDTRNNPRTPATENNRSDNRPPREDSRNKSFDRGHDKIADRYNERVDRFQESPSFDADDRHSNNNDRNNRRNTRTEQAPAHSESARNKNRPQDNRPTPSERPQRERPNIETRNDNRSNDNNRNNNERRNEPAERQTNQPRSNERVSAKHGPKPQQEDGYSRRNPNESSTQSNYTEHDTHLAATNAPPEHAASPRPRPTKEANKNVLRAANLPYYAADNQDAEHLADGTLEHISPESGFQSDTTTHFTPKSEELQAIVDYFNQHFHVGSTYQKTLFGMVVKQATNKTTVEVLNSKNARPLIMALLHNACIEEVDDQNFKVLREAELDMLTQRKRHQPGGRNNRNSNRRSFQSRKPRSSSRSEESVM
jgi:hypothetical protein